MRGCKCEISASENRKELFQMNKRMISLMMAGAMVLTSSCAGAETMKR